jgi:hypothetical protein
MVRKLVVGNEKSRYTNLGQRKECKEVTVTLAIVVSKNR